MTEFVSFPSTSDRHDLPFLIAGQAQKEYFVNEALARIDMLLHPVVEGELSGPPAEPAVGLCYIVGTGAGGAWADETASIAGWDGTQWTFVKPAYGMAAFDRSIGQSKFFKGFWAASSGPEEPAGGAVIDTQARDAIANILVALRIAGIIS